MVNNSEVLTRDAWIERCLYWVDGKSAEFWGKIFDSFDGDPELKDFLSYANSRQSNILKWIAKGVSVSSVISYLNICNRLDTKFEKMSQDPDVVYNSDDSIGWQVSYFHCDELVQWQLENLIDRMIGDASVGFLESIKEMRKTIERFSNLPYSTQCYHFAETCHILRSLHSEELVIEVLTRCIEFEIPVESCQLVQLVDDWDTVREYPIDWALNVARASSSTEV